jgi:hypothetical protein
MKYCYECGRITAGKPLFCSYCARTYDLKLCPRLHPNRRAAEVCSQCGSRELSTPQPKVSVWWRLIEWVVRAFLAVFLFFLSCVGAIAAFKGMLESPQMQSALIGLAILLGVLWWMWSELPQWVRKLVRKSLQRKRSGDEH